MAYVVRRWYPTAEDRALVGVVDPGAEQCGQTPADGFLGALHCQRAPGHDGKHVAADRYGWVIFIDRDQLDALDELGRNRWQW